MNETRITERFGAPGKWDQLPYGTAFKVSTKEGVEVYMQCSHNEELPRWALIGTFPKGVIDSAIREEISKITTII